VSRAAASLALPLAEKGAHEKPFRPRKNTGGGVFWKTLFAKASARTWSQQDRELITLEMCGQAVFSSVRS
jgi:hypothetical protein